MAQLEGPMTVTPNTMPDGDCAIWGPDGDLVAMVKGNLALEVDAEDAAALFAASPNLLNDLKLATRSVRILGEMLQGKRRKSSEEIEAAIERIARYERTIKQATTRHEPQPVESI